MSYEGKHRGRSHFFTSALVGFSKIITIMVVLMISMVLSVVVLFVIVWAMLKMVPVK